MEFSSNSYVVVLDQTAAPSDTPSGPLRVHKDNVRPAPTYSCRIFMALTKAMSSAEVPSDGLQREWVSHAREYLHADAESEVLHKAHPGPSANLGYVRWWWWCGGGARPPPTTADGCHGLKLYVSPATVLASRLTPPPTRHATGTPFDTVW